jgi:DNA-directed RNA polymerase specialized sigma subunit
MSFESENPVPRSVAEKLRAVRRTANGLAAMLCRDPTRTELAEALGLDEEQLRQIAEQANRFGAALPDVLRD